MFFPLFLTQRGWVQGKSGEAELVVSGPDPAPPLTPKRQCQTLST